MPFKGTDLNAWDKAKKGKTPAQRSRIYKLEKEKNEKDRKRSYSVPSVNLSTYKPKTTTKSSFAKPKYIQSETIKKPVISNSQSLKNKYVPKQLILDDIREYRSSKLISNISDGLATVIMKTTRNKNMTNVQMNLIRSSVALVTSEVINRALEKPLEIIDNIKMFIKVGKAVYKVIIWFNDEIASYEVQENSIENVSPLSNEYRRFLRQNPKIKNVYRHQADCKILGKTVKVNIDRPLGSKDPTDEGIENSLNYGYLQNIFANDGSKQEAYIMGEKEPLQEFIGQVVAIVNRLNDKKDILVVSKGNHFTKQEIAEAIDFKERFFEFELTTM